MALNLGFRVMVLSRRGFTFVELLLASTMIAILIVGLAVHLRGGMAVWREATQTVEALQRRRAAFDQLASDLAGAFIYDTGTASANPADEGQPPAMELGSDRLFLYTVSSGWANRLPAVRFVTYACGRMDGKQGFWRTSQPVMVARKKTIAPAPELLLPDCEEMAVRYAYAPSGSTQDAQQPFDWRNQWVDTQKLPRLLELSLTVSKQPVKKVMVVPAGILRSFESTESTG